MKEALAYYGWAILWLFFGYIAGGVLPPFITFPGARVVLTLLSALCTVGVAVNGLRGWWHFAQWVWGLLVGTKR